MNQNPVQYRIYSPCLKAYLSDLLGSNAKWSKFPARALSFASKAEVVGILNGFLDVELARDCLIAEGSGRLSFVMVRDPASKRWLSYSNIDGSIEFVKYRVNGAVFATVDEAVNAIEKLTMRLEVVRNRDNYLEVAYLPNIAPIEDATIGSDWTRLTR